MSFSITITADTLEGVKSQALAFAGAPVVAAAAPKPTKPAKTEAAPAAPAPASTPASSETPATPPTGPATTTGAAASTSTSPTTAELEEQVRALLTPLLRDPDQAPKVAELMAKFGATKLSKIPAESLGEVLAEASKLAAAVETAKAAA